MNAICEGESVIWKGEKFQLRIFDGKRGEKKRKKCSYDCRSGQAAGRGEKRIAGGNYDLRVSVSLSGRRRRGGEGIKKDFHSPERWQGKKEGIETCASTQKKRK